MAKSYNPFERTTKTSTSTNNMFPALEEGWNNALGSADKVFKNAKAPKQAPLSSYTKDAFAQTANLANQGVPNLDQLYATQAGILGSGGMTKDMQDSVGYLTNFANGSYQEDPRLAAAIAEREKRAMNGAATQFGGGRYGSVAIGQGMGGAMATAGNDLMLQSNENARNRQLQASGQIGQLGTAGAQNMATWASMSPALNEMRYDGATRLASMGQYMQDREQQRIDNKLGFDKQNVGWYTGILGGMGNQGSTTVAKTPGPSAAEGVLGGIGAGAKIGASIPGVGPGWGGVVGAGFGAASAWS